MRKEFIFSSLSVMLGNSANISASKFKSSAKFGKVQVADCCIVIEKGLLYFEIIEKGLLYFESNVVTVGPTGEPMKYVIKIDKSASHSSLGPLFRESRKAS